MTLDFLFISLHIRPSLRTTRLSIVGTRHAVSESNSYTSIITRTNQVYSLQTTHLSIVGTRHAVSESNSYTSIITRTNQVYSLRTTHLSIVGTRHAVSESVAWTSIIARTNQVYSLRSTHLCGHGMPCPYDAITFTVFLRIRLAHIDNRINKSSIFFRGHSVYSL